MLHELPTTPDCDVTVYSYDLLSNEPFYFNNRDKVSGFLSVWQAARATSAAPTFFPALKLEHEKTGSLLLTDGGVYINNPALNLLIRARKIFPQIKKQSQMLVSLGTGQFSPSLAHLENAGIGRLSLDPTDSWGKAIFSVTSMGTSAEADYQTSELLEYLDPKVFHDEQEYQQRYYRFQKKFREDVPMDGISQKQISRLEQLGDELVKERREELDQLCEVLTTSIDINESDVQVISDFHYQAVG